MKKVIISFLLALMTTGITHAVSYRGFANLGSGILIEPETDEIHVYFSVNTTHGAQLNRHFFIGAGVNLSLHDGENFYSGYGAIRYDYDITKKWSPFAEVKLGYQSPIHSYETNSINALYFSPSVGARLKLSRVCGLNFGLSYSPITRHYHYEYNYGDNSRSKCNAVFFNIGVDF
ncbi:MAG: hypothetical protein K2N79_08710 [Muribaculaceae bacterium]|nr:hypothetical protein [Muribaculaceae bacterium]MDE7156351.1 hypothetical protein [Muribaculaceae bacterium]MDE7369948.1 hypothetical protein [Muribaculaceae bacterium]